MARRSGIGDLVYYAALGGIAYIGYRMALSGQLGKPVQDVVAQVHTSVTGRPPALPAGTDGAPVSGRAPAPSGGIHTLVLTDLGGQPLEWRNGRICQAMAGGHCYGAGDVFLARGTEEGDILWQWDGDTTLTRMDTLGQVDVSRFFAQ